MDDAEYPKNVPKDAKTEGELGVACSGAEAAGSVAAHCLVAGDAGGVAEECSGAAGAGAVAAEVAEYPNSVLKDMMELVGVAFAGKAWGVVGAGASSFFSGDAGAGGSTLDEPKEKENMLLARSKWAVLYVGWRDAHVG